MTIALGRRIGLHAPDGPLGGVVVTNLEPYRAEDYIEHGSLRHRGIVGCFRAHRNALANLPEIAERRRLNADDYVLVIEDDIRIDARFLDHTRRLPDGPWTA